MSVIVTGMDMPESCFECSTKVDPETRRCNIDGLLFEETFELCTSKRHPNCPLKSVDGLIEQIGSFVKKQEQIAFAVSDLNERNAHLQKENAYRQCLQVIKEYCEEGTEA